MKYCFHCGTTLNQVRSTSAWTDRFKCGKCKKGFLLSERGNCLFLSDTVPEDKTPDCDFGFDPAEGESHTVIVNGDGRASYDFGF